MSRSGSSHIASRAALASIATLAAFAAAAYAGGTPSKTTSTAKDPKTILSPKTSPVKIGDVAKGKPLPRGAALVSRQVTVKRGKDKGKSTNVVMLTCPGSRTVSAIADSKMPNTFNKQSTYGRGVAKVYPTAYDLKAGKSRTGTLYALCDSNA